jgi:hypothetical protein
LSCTGHVAVHVVVWHPPTSRSTYAAMVCVYGRPQIRVWTLRNMVVQFTTYPGWFLRSESFFKGDLCARFEFKTLV